MAKKISTTRSATVKIGGGPEIDLDELTGANAEIKMIKDMDWRIFTTKGRIKTLMERREEILSAHPAYDELLKAQDVAKQASEKLKRALLADADYNEVMESLAEERLTLHDDQDILSLHVVEYYTKTHEHQVELGDRGEARDIIVTGRLGKSGQYQTNLFSKNKGSTDD